MKKIIFFIIFFIILSSNVFSANLATIYGGGPNIGTNCGSGKVPRDSDTYRSGTSYTCVSHKYYSSYYYKNTSRNHMTMCNGEDRVVGVSGTKIKCQRHDDIAPSGSVSYSPNSGTKGNVKVTISCTDNAGSGCSMYNISGWSKSGTKYYKTFSSNINGYIILKDKAGNTKNINYIVDKIDNGNLTTIYWGGSNNGTDCGSGKVPRDSDTYRSGTSYTCISHKYYSSYYYKNTSKNHMTMCNGEDRVVGVSGTKIKCQRHDDIAPSGSVSYSPNSWTRGNVTVNITCSDTGGSGCNMYNISGWSKSGARYYKSFNSNTSGHITLKDKAGNARNIYYTVNKIDKTAPVTSATASSNTWKKDNIIIKLSGTDTGGSGIKTLKYRFNNSDCWDGVHGINFTNNENILLTTDGNHTLYLCSEDNVGNKSTWSGTYRLDKVVPNLPIINSDRSNNTWSKDKNVSMTVSTASTSGVSTPKNYYCLDSNNSCNPNSLTKPNTSNLSDGIHYFRVKTCSESNLCSNTVVFTLKIDTVKPTLNDIFKNGDGKFTNGFNSGDYNRATDSQEIGFYIKNQTNSPISKIKTKLENSTVGGVDKDLIFNTGNGFKILNNDFSIVKGDLKDSSNGKNYREYSFYIKQICDEANNCLALNKEYIFNYYAYLINYASFPGYLDFEDGIADGKSNILRVIMKDEYDNRILPVKKSNNQDIIKVNLDIKYENTLYLNQYNQVGGSSVFIGTEQLSNGISSKNFNNDSYGEYKINFKIYSPTEDYKTKGVFNIKNINGKTSEYKNGGWSNYKKDNLLENLNFKFKPLYKTEFYNYSAKDSGFSEGINQIGVLKLKKEIGGSNIENNSGKIYLEFGKYNGTGTGGVDNEENPNYTLSNNDSSSYSGTIVEGYSSNYSNRTSLNNFGDNNINTLLVQDSGYGNPSDSYLASIIKYKIDGKTIIYPSDIAGKENYFGNIITNRTTNKGVKILGKTYSEKQKNIIADQNGDVNKVIGKITKATLRADIRSNAYKLIKNLGVSVGENKELLKENVIYYRLDGGNIKYSDIDNDYGITSGKTILVEGGDLIIDKDINISGIMGIVVLQNSNKNGGKILIDDDVTNINAVMYTDKTLIPYNSIKGELKQSDGIGYFKNQLFIKGTIFSNNTLGGSRAEPKICPYYITQNCDMEEAQKYDLNFIRRYYRYNNGGTWIIANSGNSSSGITGDDLDYPLIIKYNPLIQTTPPPLFAK